MPPIKTSDLISHTHTDIGFTHHHEPAIRQHLEFGDLASDIGATNADFPPEAC